jgi:hypothetical protein
MVVYPLRGVGPLRFGMTIRKVRKVLGVPYKSFTKGRHADYPTDAFYSRCLHVYYRDPGVCEAVELFHPAEVMWHGKNLLKETPSDLLRLLASEDSAIEEDPDGFASHKLGIAAYVPGYKKNPGDSCVEGILVFEEGYYGKK